MEKIRVTLFDQAEALSAALAVNAGARDQFERVVRACGDRYGGVDRLLFALAYELNFAYMSHCGDKAAENMRNLEDLHRVSVNASASVEADIAESQTELAAFKARRARAAAQGGAQ